MSNPNSLKQGTTFQRGIKHIFACATFRRGLNAHVCTCRQGEYMWRYVKDKLTASLLMLGHAWPLSEALDNHPLVNSINQLHKACHKQLANTRDTDTETESSGSDPPESAETTEADNKDKPEGLRCAKCNQKIPQVCFSCKSWHSCSLHTCTISSAS